MWLSRNQDARDDHSRKVPLMQRLSTKLHLWSQAMEGMDDPLCDDISRLEDRVRRLEGEVEQLRKLLSGHAASTGTVPGIVSLQQHQNNSEPRA